MNLNPMIDSMKKKLRIGLLIDEYHLPAWIYEAIEKIYQSQHSTISLVIKNKVTGETNSGKLSWYSTSSFIFFLLHKIDQQLFRNHPDAFRLKDVRNIFERETLEVIPKSTQKGIELMAEDINRLKNYKLDILIQFGFRKLYGEIFSCARYGIWSFQEGSETVEKGGLAGIWEVINRSPETRIALQIIYDSGQMVKVFESFSSTDKYSFKRNRDLNYWKASSVLPRKLEKLYYSGESFLRKKSTDEEQAPGGHNRELHFPQNHISVRTFIRIYYGKIYNIFQKQLYEEQWILMYENRKSVGISFNFPNFVKILPPPDRFWADPFVIKWDGAYFIFFEELLFKENKGRIAVLKINDDGTYSKPQIVLDKDYHLSYPFLIEEKGELFMIPETSNNNNIELYRCTNFPDKWELAEVLMDNVHAVDTTIFKKDDKFWMFCNMKEHDGASANDELFLFYSTDLVTNKWFSHPENPIISDVKNSRPAGNIFMQDGKLFRPSQNCALRYGYGIQINEIIDMDVNSYKESTVKSIQPEWEKGLLATHTINYKDGFTIIDAMIKRRK